MILLALSFLFACIAFPPFYRTPDEDRNRRRPLETSSFGISSCTRPCCCQRCSDTDPKVGQFHCCGVSCVLILSMSFRVGGRARRRGGARKADRAPKSAADLDAEMEVCTFKTLSCLSNLRLCRSGLYCQQWSRACCRCLSNFDLCLVYCTLSFYVVLFSIPLLSFIPCFMIEPFPFLSCHLVLCCNIL